MSIKNHTIIIEYYIDFIQSLASQIDTLKAESYKRIYQDVVGRAKTSAPEVVTVAAISSLPDQRQNAPRQKRIRAKL